MAGATPTPAEVDVAVIFVHSLHIVMTTGMFYNNFTSVLILSKFDEISCHLHELCQSIGKP
jgi:hypothetical protein